MPRGKSEKSVKDTKKRRKTGKGQNWVQGDFHLSVNEMQRLFLKKNKQSERKLVSQIKKKNKKERKKERTKKQTTKQTNKQ